MSELVVCLNSLNSGKIKPPSEQTLSANASSSSLMYRTASSTTLSWNANNQCQEYIKNIKTEFIFMKAFIFLIITMKHTLDALVLEAIDGTMILREL